jgi:glycosyltransferase involved in cell wall biosynthesis
MAVGIAALVTDLPGRGELVRAEGCGIAVPAGLDGHLGGVRRLLAERDALGEMGARGREAVARKYSWERAEGALIDFYDTLCRDLPGPRG